MPRRRLLDRLEAGLQRKLTLVSTPAGFGKTTLIGEWHASPRQRELYFAWVLLDEQDNDPVRFWSYVLAALERVRPGIGESARTLLQMLPPPGVAAAYDGSRPIVLDGQRRQEFHAAVPPLSEDEYQAVVGSFVRVP